MKLKNVLVLLLGFANILEAENRDLTERQGRKGEAEAYVSKGRLNDSGDNFQYLLAYANNPFGSSPEAFHQSRATDFDFILVSTMGPLLVNQKNRSGEVSPTVSPQKETKQIEISLKSKLRDQPRTKRGVIHLYNMVKCATGCNPLIYKGYGCFCGFLGSGYPVDGIDRCCKKHDWCYDAANCPNFFEYIVPYFWKCYYGRPLCALQHGNLGGPGSCAYQLCECDRVLSECLSRYPCPSSRAFCPSSPLRFIQNALMIFP